MAAEKPTIRPFSGEGIPQALKAQKRWAPWRAVWNEKRQKYDKIPHRADRTAFGISTQRPETWFSYELALAAYQGNKTLFAGIGYVMTGPHGVVGTDLDGCVSDDGTVAPWAAEVIAKLDSYTEISPSGHGLRVLSFGEQTNDWNNHDVGIEVYGGNEARFLTVTGEHLAGSPREVRDARADVLKTLEGRYAKERRKADVIDLNMPDVLDDLLIPDVDTVDIPYASRDFLTTGSHSGDRSRALFSAAVALYTAGLDDEEVFSILADSEHAMEIALDHRRQDHDRALLYIWREHCCKGKARAAEFKALTAEDFDALPNEPATEQSPALVAANKTKPARFRVQPVIEFLKSTPMSWIIKGILPKAQLCVLFGDSGSGKTFFTLDLVGAIARGIEWRGHKVKQGRVAYICAEGAGGFRNRLAAYAHQHAVPLADLDIGVIPDAPNFMEKVDIKDLLAAIQTFGKTDVIVVDTFAQVMPGANENAGEDVGRALAHCRALHNATGALIILIHHTGKDASRGARGWSGVRGAADAQIEIVRSGDDRTAIIDKMKDGAGEGDEYGFKLLTVPIGIDEDDEEITSCVLEHVAAVPKAERKKEPKGAVEKLVLKVANEMMGLTDGVVAVNTLIEGCISQMVFDSSDGKRDRRREVSLRAFTALQAANRLGVKDGCVVVL